MMLWVQVVRRIRVFQVPRLIGNCLLLLLLLLHMCWTLILAECWIITSKQDEEAGVLIHCPCGQAGTGPC